MSGDAAGPTGQAGAPASVAETLRAAAARLQAAGVPDAARDARRLLAAAMAVPADRLSLDPHAPVEAVAAARLAPMLAARAARQPVSQILGRRLFWGREFRVTPDVLDPRPETETLIEAALAAPFASLLDLGTGSGAILLSLLAERPGARGLGVDISPAALSVAEGNARALGLADRAVFRRSDWCAAVTGRFDLIISNPPYIARAEMTALSPEVRDWEPEGALLAGEDGLDAYRLILAQAPAHLARGGRLMVEIGPTQAEAITALFLAAGLIHVETHRDMDGRDRVVLGHST